MLLGVRGICCGSEVLPWHVNGYVKQSGMQRNTEAILIRLSIHPGEDSAVNIASEFGEEKKSLCRVFFAMGGGAHV